MTRKRLVYVVGTSDNPVKIGVADDMDARLAGLQCGCPELLIVHYTLAVPFKVAHAVETACHKHFAEHHRRGEWFNVHKDDAIEALRRIGDQVSNEAFQRVSRHGDATQMMDFLFGMSPDAPDGLRSYKGRLFSAGGAKKVAEADAHVLNRAGQVGYTLFKRMVSEETDLWDLIRGLRLDHAGTISAYQASASAINALAEYEYKRRARLAA
jgi:hypothetical protein